MSCTLAEIVCRRMGGDLGEIIRRMLRHDLAKITHRLGELAEVSYRRSQVMRCALGGMNTSPSAA